MSKNEDLGRRMSSRPKRQRSYDEEPEEIVAPAKHLAKPGSVQKQGSTSVSPHDRGMGAGGSSNRATDRSATGGGSSSDGGSSGSRGIPGMHESMMDFGALGLRIRSASEDASALEAQLGRPATAVEKQELRKQRNRESAALSRQRSKTYTKALEEKIMELQGRVAELEGELERYAEGAGEHEHAAGHVHSRLDHGHNGSAPSAGSGTRKARDSTNDVQEYSGTRGGSRASAHGQDRSSATYSAAVAASGVAPNMQTAAHAGAGSAYGDPGHGLSSGRSGGAGFYPPSVGLVRSESYPLSSNSAYRQGSGPGLYAAPTGSGQTAQAGPALGLGLARTQSFHPGDLPPASAFSAGPGLSAPTPGGGLLLPPSIASLAPPGRGSSHKKTGGSTAPSRTGSYGSTGYAGREEEGSSSAERGRSRSGGVGASSSSYGTGAGAVDEQGPGERMSVISSREGSRDREREQDRVHSTATSRTRQGSEDMRGSTGTGSSGTRSMYAGPSSGSVDWSATALGGLTGIVSRSSERPARAGSSESGSAATVSATGPTHLKPLAAQGDGRATPDNSNAKASDSESGSAGPLASPARSTASGVERDRDVAALLAGGLR